MKYHTETIQQRIIYKLISNKGLRNPLAGPHKNVIHYLLFIGIMCSKFHLGDLKTVDVV